MLDSAQIKKTLNSKLPELQRKYPVARLGLFGSYSRGEQTENSDIDILVELNGEIGWDYFDLCFELKDLFPDKKVDVVSRKAIQPNYWMFVKEDLLYV